MISVDALVRRVCPGLRPERLHPKARAAIEHAIRNHVQTVYCLEAALEDRVREIITPVVEAAPAGHRGRER